MLTTASRLAVWGDPIAHSRSPQLHAAAYDVLGLDWIYERRQVTAVDFPGALGALDAQWRGLSLTYPLKTAAFAAAHTRDRRAELTGAVNTLLLGGDGPHGFNTDVGGIVSALREAGLPEGPRARILGAGATATSSIVALGELGTRDLEVVARRPEAVTPLIALGERLGIRVVAAPFTDAPAEVVPLTIATLPGESTIPDAAARAFAEAGGLLLDVVYGTWPTALAVAWQKAGGTALSGRGMLLHQAVLQIRIFLNGNPDATLPDEPAVLAAMRLAVMGD